MIIMDGFFFHRRNMLHSTEVDTNFLWEQEQQSIIIMRLHCHCQGWDADSGGSVV